MYRKEERFRYHSPSWFLSRSWYVSLRYTICKFRWWFYFPSSGGNQQAVYTHLVSYQSNFLHLPVSTASTPFSNSPLNIRYQMYSHLLLRPLFLSQEVSCSLECEQLPVHSPRNISTGFLHPVDASSQCYRILVSIGIYLKGKRKLYELEWLCYIVHIQNIS